MHLASLPIARRERARHVAAKRKRCLVVAKGSPTPQPSFILMAQPRNPRPTPTPPLRLPSKSRRCRPAFSRSRSVSNSIHIPSLQHLETLQRVLPLRKVLLQYLHKLAGVLLLATRIQGLPDFQSRHYARSILAFSEEVVVQGFEVWFWGGEEGRELRVDEFGGFGRERGGEGCEGVLEAEELVVMGCRARGEGFDG